MMPYIATFLLGMGICACIVFSKRRRSAAVSEPAVLESAAPDPMRVRVRTVSGMMLLITARIPVQDGDKLVFSAVNENGTLQAIGDVVIETGKYAAWAAGSKVFVIAEEDLRSFGVVPMEKR